MRESVRRRFIVRFAIPLIVGMGLLVGAFHYLGLLDRYLNLEAQSLAWLLNRMGLTAYCWRNTVWLHPVIGAVTLSCSSLGSAIILLFLFLLTPTVPVGRNIAAAVLAVGLVYIGNLLRLMLVLIIGHYWGAASMLTFHDWFGPAITILYVLIAYWIWSLIVVKRRRRPYFYYRWD